LGAIRPGHDNIGQHTAASEVSGAGLEASWVSELDEAWALAVAEAEMRAHSAGRKDVAEYLALRASNDLLRQTAIEWLINTFTVLAGEANRRGGSIQISRDDKHRFKVGNATMVGRLLTLRNGVRRLSIEAGWPRAPRDGFIRGGGLACANIRHMGIKSASQELLLVRSTAGAPGWMIVSTSVQSELHEANVSEHITLLLHDIK